MGSAENRLGLREVAAHLWPRNRSLIGLTVVVMTVTVSVVTRLLYTGQLSAVWEWFEPVLGFTTLLVAILIWVNEEREALESALDKRMTVEFEFENEVMLRWQDVPLTSEADMRSLGLSLGKQMNAGRELSVIPVPTVKSRVLQRSGATRWMYVLSFQLLENVPKVVDRKGMDRKQWDSST